MKLRVEEALEEQKKVDLERRERNVQLQAEIRVGNQLLQRVREDVKEREREDEKRIAEHF